MEKSKKQKKAEFQLLLSSVIESLSDSMPKGVNMLVKSVVKSIDEDKIDTILEGVKTFAANIFAHVERIQADVLDEIETRTGTNG